MCAKVKNVCKINFKTFILIDLHYIQNKANTQ